MAKYYGYCYDPEGKFTEMIPLEEKPIYEKQTFYREEQKEIVTEEKLCELHQSMEDGTYKEPITKYDCSDCVMRNVDYETIKVPYQEDVVVGLEPDIPKNCTLEVCPDGIYYPLFKDGKWVKTVEPEFEYPKEEPSEIEKIKKQQELMQRAMDEMIIQNPTPEELALVKKRLILMQSAIDDLIISTTPVTIEGGSN